MSAPTPSSASSSPASSFSTAGRLRTALAVLYAVGAALSLISLYHYTKLNFVQDAEPSFCNLGAALNCDVVNKSAFSTVLGIPLAAYGLTFYLSLLGLTVLLPARGDGRLTGGSVHLVLTFLASLLSVALFAISELVIGSLCLVCLGMYLVNLLSLLVSYRLEKARPFFRRVTDGAASIVTAPSYLLSGDSAERRAGWNVFLTIVVACLVAYASPLMFKANLAAKKRTAAPVQADPVQKWNESPPRNLDLQLGEGSDVDFSKGPVFAPIRVVEFADFECPMCRRFFPEIEEVLSQYPGKVHYVFKNYPIDRSCNPTIPREAHKYACYSALFARCAGEQGKFWEAADYLFRLPALESRDSADAVKASIMEGAGLLRLDAQGLKQCMQSGRQNQKILDDIRIGNAVEIPGTPTVFVNGKELPAATKSTLKAVIEYILKGNGGK